MPLPRHCCCCLQLDIGSHILNGLSIIGHTSVLVDTLLDFDAAEYADEDTGKVMHVTIVLWCLVGIFISTLLTLSIAMVSTSTGLECRTCRSVHLNHLMQCSCCC